jgi:NADH-quinone oxidoreductase subunit E
VKSVESKEKEKLVNKLKDIKKERLEKNDEILMALHEAQKLFENSIPLEAAEIISKELNVKVGRIYELATFYSMYSTKTRGKHIIRYCESLPCHVRGGREVKDALEKVLGIKSGETTKDGMFTLEASSCLGLCGVGPVIMIDTEAIGNVTPEKVREIIEKYRGEQS